MNSEQLWQAALGQLQMEMPRAAFDTWVRDTELLTYEDGAFVIGVRNAYARDWLEDRLLSTVKQVLTGILGRTVEVRFVVWHEDNVDESPEPVLKASSGSESNLKLSANLTSRYTFESFVVGSSNRLAHAACQAVAESPARAYNPLFLYGGVGLGKTHLLHAIGHICATDGLNVLYVSSEEFTNDLINAIRTHTTDAFRERYRRIDLLLIDDIQFLVGKESTQEEFFHTFNTLHGQDKQLVISSDRPPKALATLEERLRSRFEWGLTADIQLPDFETRLAILRSKAERARRSVESELLELIARRVQSNIRELEGALTRVLAFSDLSGAPLSRELVETALIDLLPRGDTLTVERIIAVVARQFGIEVDRLLSRERSREVALPRQVAMYLMREETSASLPQIGEALGGRDHTTVIYGYDKITNLMETDDVLRRQVLLVREKLFHEVGIPA
ncbi:MAG: chromosomal replication initiator DnaA [Anaerolineae bacterium SM23_ 63]|nr:MAG: chromosomal replication initiator DnaA [Anaerolineae bacterium SM23_ 63]HEY46525.1 chromosomal replication initiator protein DnaA [Anaerolineae bacterium]